MDKALFALYKQGMLWQNHWLVLQSKIHEENRALLNLQRQGFLTYHPVILQKKRIKGAWVKCEESLFPRYIFVSGQTIHAGNWRSLRYTYGISHIVRLGNRFAWASDEVVQALKQHVEWYNAQDNIIPFKEGQKVLIADGPLKGMECIFHMPKGEERALVFLNFLQRQTPVEVPIELLQEVRT